MPSWHQYLNTTFLSIFRPIDYLTPLGSSNVNSRCKLNKRRSCHEQQLLCICIIIVILYFQLWWPAAINPMFAESHKVFAIRYLYLHSPFVFPYTGTSNIQCSMFNVQCSMFNVQCSMFNVQILDVWHVWEGCSQRQGQRSWNWNWGRVHCLQKGLILSQAKCLVL